MGKLTTKIIELENKIAKLEAKVMDLSQNTEESNPVPYSKVGGEVTSSLRTPIDPVSGWGIALGGPMIWNDVDLTFPALNSSDWNLDALQPSTGYNRHMHSRYAGGALDIHTVEFVEYDLVDKNNPVVAGDTFYAWDSQTWNKQLMSYWSSDPDIATALNTDNERVKKIGHLDLTFNADTRKWGMAASEINVKETYLVLRDSDGNIQTDDNGNEMKAPLYNTDAEKTCIAWDASAQCWRFFAVFKD